MNPINYKKINQQTINNWIDNPSSVTDPALIKNRI